MKRARFLSIILAAGVALLPVYEAMAQQTPTGPGGSGPRLRGGAAGTEERDRPEERSDTSRQPGKKRGGSQAGASGVTVTTGSSGDTGSRVIGGEEAFDAIRQREIEYGPLPEVSDRANMSLAGPMSAVEFLDALSLATGWNIAATVPVKDLVLQFWTKEVSPKQAVAILKFNEIYYEFDEETNFLFVMTEGEYLARRYGTLVEHEFEIQHADLVDVETAVSSLLSAQGRVITDPNTSKLLVFDTADNVEHMMRAVEEMDQVRDTLAIPLQHADAEALIESLGALLTESGQLSIDPRSNTLIVMDRPERVTRIADVVAMLDKELETRSWTLDYADPEEVGENLFELIPEAMGTVVVNEAIHKVTVTATPARLAEVDARISAWDEMRRQVQIEAYLATATSNVLRELGFNWSYATTIDGDLFSVELGNSGSALGGLAGSQQLTFVSDNLTSMIDSLDTSTDATILAHPRIAVQDGVEAVFDNTTQVPFASATTTFGGNQSTLVNTNTRIEFIDVGTILSVIPRITTDDNIRLEITAEDSSFESVDILANGVTNTLPQKTQNKAQTQVMVGNQETIMLGGLRTANYADSVDRVPILGRIPLLGRLFRSTSKDHQDRELLIFITPTIMDGTTQEEAVRLAAFDDELATTLRRDEMSALGRIREKLRSEKRDISVVVGQTGGLLAEGEMISLEGLRGLLQETRRPGSKRVIIREHPRAAPAIATEIAEIAIERGMKVEYDDRRMPFAPSVVEEAGAGR